MSQVLQVVFNTIVTHARPHLDEIFAIYLLMTLGEKIFPGISKAKIVPEGHGGEQLLGCSAEELEAQGIICVGVGSGRFDEHANATEGRKKNESACTLVARALGLENDPTLERITEFVKDCDLNASAHPFGLSRMVKDMHEDNPDDPEFVINWTMRALRAKHAAQIRFVQAQREVLETATVEEINTPRGKVKLFTCVTDNEQFSVAARANGAGIIIQQNSKGQVQIFNNNKIGLRMSDVVKLIRLEEQFISGELVTTDWKTLESEGNVPGAMQWHFKEAGQGIMNGSKTHQDITATKIPFERIKQLVCLALNPEGFPEDRAAHCKNGICNSTLRNPCPLYECGFHRCQTIRYKQKTSK